MILMTDKENYAVVSSIDHIVITASQIDQTISFYRDILGMKLDTFTPKGEHQQRHALKFGNQKINLHSEKTPFKPHAENPISGAVDICFLSATPVEKWQNIFLENNIKVENGPLQKTGATGPIRSIYVNSSCWCIINIFNYIGHC